MKAVIAISAVLMSLSGFASETDDHQLGEKLFGQYCNVCHGMSGGMNKEKRIAPPIAGVRMHYMSVHAEKEPFINAITSWLEKPDESKSLMPGAIQHFKLMPPIAVPKEEAKKIAAFIYDGNIPTPAGYQQHFNQMHGKQKGMQQNRDNRFTSLLRRQLRMTGEQIAAMKLSQEQMQKLRELVIEKEAIMQPLREEVLEFNQRLLTLDSRNPNYKSEIFSLADINAKRVEQMVVKSGEMRMKIESVLNQEQYQTLLDVRKQMTDRYNKMRKMRQPQ